MELKIKEVTLPEVIEFNYQELKQELEEKVSVYSTIVYTDETIKEAKADRATLNKLKKALNDERIRMEKEYMVPFNSFKTKVNEIIGIIDKPVNLIDMQVKEYEEKKKKEKLDEITNFFGSTFHPEWLKLSQIMDDKWLNASVSMKSVQDSIIAGLEKVKTDIETLSNLPEFGFEATEVYKSSLDINKAITEAQRMSQIAKAKAEAEAEQARLKAEAEFAQAMNPPVVNGLDGGVYVQDADKQGWTKFDPPVEAEAIEKPKTWVKFQALMTVDQAFELKKFFDERSIEFKAV